MSQGAAAFDLPADPFFNIRFNPAYCPCSQGHRSWEASLTHPLVHCAAGEAGSIEYVWQS
jgi:hypothetical protein